MLWADITGYEDRYQVSSTGLVRSLPRATMRGNRPWHYAGKLLTPGLTPKGYLTVSLSANSDARSHFVHRLVAQAFLANPGMLGAVNHKNGVKIDNQVANLEWVSEAGNKLHAASMGLMSRGEDHFHTTLTEADVIDIYHRAHAGERQQDVADDYGIAAATVSQIKTGKNWSWLTKGV